MTLQIATEGACKGHKCDNCATCRKGRCCRRDNPDYKLPGLGEWDGPIYGELGVLNDDGDKVECHCCGEWFANLARHVWASHGLYAQEYKALFGLSRRTGLWSKQLASRLSAHGRWLGTTFEGGKTVLKQRTSEQLSMVSSQPRRMQFNKKMQRRTPRQGIKGKYSPVPLAGVQHRGKRYTARLLSKGINFYLGTFDSPEEAARAYDAKARELYGDQARLNFPDT